MATRMGWDPPPINVYVNAGGVFNARGTFSTALGVGDTVDLYFTGDDTPITWTATLDGDRLTATWTKTVANVAALIATLNRSVALRYTPASGEPTIWRRGDVHVA